LASHILRRGDLWLGAKHWLAVRGCRMFDVAEVGGQNTLQAHGQRQGGMVAARCSVLFWTPENLQTEVGGPGRNPHCARDTLADRARTQFAIKDWDWQ